MASLIGNYDPKAMQKQALSRGLLGLGIGMLNQQPSRFPISFGQSLGAGAQGFATGMDQGKQEYYSMLEQQREQLKQEQKEKNKAAFAKIVEGLDPNDPVRLAWQTDPDGTAGLYAEELVKNKFKGNDETYYGQPLWSEDDRGNRSAYQLGNRGTAKRVDVPGKVFDPYTKAYETKKGATEGEASGDAVTDLPRVEINATQTLGLIEKLKNHPGRQGATGLIQGNLPTVTAATNDFRIMLDQAVGKTFLEAYQTLKGGGQITEVEGTKAQNAIARLQRAQSDDEFLVALNELEQVVMIGLERARAAAARQPGQPPSGAPASDIDALVNRYRSK